MSEVRNALTKTLADGLYLRLDASNAPMLGNLNMGQKNLLNVGDIVIESDTKALYLGAGLDVLLQYTGLVAYLNTGLITPSDFIVDCGTKKTLVLQKPVWEDLRVPLTASRPGPLNPPTLAKFLDNGAGSVGIYTCSFSDEALANKEEQLFFNAQLPHKYKQGTDIKVHIHWLPAVTGNLNEFVKWGLEYGWKNIDGIFVNSTIILSDASNALTATRSGDTILIAKKHYVSNIGIINGSSKEISSILGCRVFRNSSDAEDNLAQDAFGLEVDFHFQIDTVGSRQEYSK